MLTREKTHRSTMRGLLLCPSPSVEAGAVLARIRSSLRRQLLILTSRSLVPIVVTLVLTTTMTATTTASEGTRLATGNTTATGLCCGDWYIPHFSLMDDNRTSCHLGAANTTSSSMLLMLLVPLHDESYMDAGHDAPWKLWYGQSPFDYPLGLNRSLVLDFVGYNRSLFPVETLFDERRKLLVSDDSAATANLHRHRVLAGLSGREQIAAGGTAGAFFTLLLCSFAVFLLWRTCWKKYRAEARRNQQQPQAYLCTSGPRRYSHQELAAATRGFSEEELIGRGGFGPVYRGYLPLRDNDDQDCRVAIKVLSQSLEGSSSAQGHKEFEAEVKVMMRLRHRNIVQLLGWFDGPGPGGPMLVYELVPNGSLDRHLYDHTHTRLPLAWSDRYKIALGVGSAILYLHTECNQCILHGDIKPANILLDPCFNPKLADFGLARLVDHGTDSPTTQVVAGTLGYIDPELVNNGRPSRESDVYSFGVVLLEIACGRRATTARSDVAPALLNWVRDMYRADSVLAVADRRLDGEFDAQQMRRLLIAGLWCTHHDQSQRPSITEAMDYMRHRQDAELLPPILSLPQMDSRPAPDASLRSLHEEIAYADFPAEDSAAFQYSSADTAYHTSKDSNCLLLVQC